MVNDFLSLKNGLPYIRRKLPHEGHSNSIEDLKSPLTAKETHEVQNLITGHLEKDSVYKKQNPVPMSMIY